MKKKKKLTVIIISVTLAVCVLAASAFAFFRFADFVLNDIFPDCIPDGSFSSVEEAMKAYGDNVREVNDINYDVWPPYDILYRQELGDKTVIVFSYYYDGDLNSFGGYGVQAFKKWDDGTVTFDDFSFLNSYTEPELYSPLSESCTIFYSDGGKDKMAEYVYMPVSSKKDMYIDGVKAEKVKLSYEKEDFYLCYVLRDKKWFLGELLGTKKEYR